MNYSSLPTHWLSFYDLPDRGWVEIHYLDGSITRVGRATLIGPEGLFESFEEFVAAFVTSNAHLHEAK